MPDTFVDYFRCPPQSADFAVRGQLSADEGFFRFRGATCYGRGSAATLPAAAADVLPDLSRDVDVARGRVGLPFDLSEIVTNLRHERYRHEDDDSVMAKVATSGTSERLYYLVRPLLPVGVRKHLQRIRLSGWDKIAFPSWPVDLTVESLMQSAMALAIASNGGHGIPFVWFWPEGANAAAIVTHDVEAPSGLAFCRRLMEIDESYGFRSSFQMVPELRYETSQPLFDELREHGFEINVHDLNHDGFLFHDREQFHARAAQINRYAKEFGSRGFRSACMYREQEWFHGLDVSYDMSVPNVAHLEPQRGGCCTVLPFFIGDLVELPLTTIQDYSLFHILNQYSIDVWKRQIATIEEANGLITILTHPDYLVDESAQRVYRDLLAYLRELREGGQIWFALPGDVERWWRNRSQMTLVRDGSGWRIEGPDSERARVACASLEDNRVVYRVDGRS